MLNFPSTPTNGQLFTTTDGSAWQWDSTNSCWRALSVDSRRAEYAYTATAGQTVFSATYTPGFIDVYLNGVRLIAADFTATNGTSVTLSSAAALDDSVVIVVPETAALVNTYTQSQSDSRYVNLDGDTMTGALTVTNASADGHALNRTTGDTRYMNLGSAFAYQGSDPSVQITSGNATKIYFQTEVYDTLSAYSTASARYTCPHAGIYHITIAAGFHSTFAGTKSLRCVINGTYEYEIDRQSGAADQALHGSIALKLSANDYIEARLYQDSGGNQWQEWGSFSNYISIECVRRTP